MSSDLLHDAVTHSLAALFITGFGYLLPTLVAWYRSHHNTAAIGALNVLLGWTVIGWIGALIWALMRPPSSGQERAGAD